MQKPDSGPEPQRRKRSKRDQAPNAYGSLLVPDLTRHWYACLVRCPECGYPHMCRAERLERITGPRQLPCKHKVVVVVARSYQRRAA